MGRLWREKVRQDGHLKMLEEDLKRFEERGQEQRSNKSTRYDTRKLMVVKLSIRLGKQQIVGSLEIEALLDFCVWTAQDISDHDNPNDQIFPSTAFAVMMNGGYQ